MQSEVGAELIAALRDSNDTNQFDQTCDRDNHVASF
jgi:hypothetical protein